MPRSSGSDSSPPSPASTALPPTPPSAAPRPPYAGPPPVRSAGPRTAPHPHTRPRRAPADLDVRAHAPELGHVHEPVLEDHLLDHALPLREAREHHELRLHVRRKARMRLRHDIDRLDVAALDAQPAALGRHGGAHR